MIQDDVDIFRFFEKIEFGHNGLGSFCGVQRSTPTAQPSGSMDNSKPMRAWADDGERLERLPRTVEPLSGLTKTRAEGRSPAKSDAIRF